MNGDLAERALAIQKNFSATWTFDTSDLGRPAAEKVLENLIGESAPAMVTRLQNEFFNLGPLEPLLKDHGVTEIIANGKDEIWLEREGRLQKCEDAFLTPPTFKNAIDRICSESGLTLNLSQPFADGRWREFRVHLACAPLVSHDFHLTLRRIAETPWTLERLEQRGWASSAQLDSMRTLIRERKNILVVGATGSGKTSVLGALLKTLPCDERAVIIEDTDELPIANAASTKLLARPPTPALRGVDLGELVRQSLRMRPQRLVVGEVRGGEAKDLLLALATGHSGSFGTLHAADARQALLRLEMLVQMGAPQWSVQAVRQLIQFSVEALVVCGNSSGHRRLEGLYKVAALESFGFLVERLA